MTSGYADLAGSTWRQQTTHSSSPQCSGPGLTAARHTCRERAKRRRACGRALEDTFNSASEACFLAVPHTTFSKLASHLLFYVRHIQLPAHQLQALVPPQPPKHLQGTRQGRISASSSQQHGGMLQLLVAWRHAHICCFPGRTSLLCRAPAFPARAEPRW